MMAQSNHMWPGKTEHKKKLHVNNQMQVHTSRPKRDTKPQPSLIFKYLKCLLSEYWIFSVVIVFTSVCK